MNIYGLLGKLVDGSTLGETDKKAAKEVIQKLDSINAFGSAARSLESDTNESVHVHVFETNWDKLNAGKLVDICRECGYHGPSYDARMANGWRGGY